MDHMTLKVEADKTTQTQRYCCDGIKEEEIQTMAIYPSQSPNGLVLVPTTSPFKAGKSCIYRYMYYSIFVSLIFSDQTFNIYSHSKMNENV